MKRKYYKTVIELEYATQDNAKVKNAITIQKGAMSIYDSKAEAFQEATKRLIKDKAIGDIYLNFTVELNGEYVDGDEDYFKLVNGQLEMI